MTEYKHPTQPATRAQTKPGPDPVDKHIGKQLKARRIMQGMTQAALGEKVNVTFQQIQKYERGKNRIGSGRLYHLAAALQVSILYFYHDLPATHKRGTAPLPSDIRNTPETFELLSAYYSIEDPLLRKTIPALAKLLASKDV